MLIPYYFGLRSELRYLTEPCRGHTDSSTEPYRWNESRRDQLVREGLADAE